MDDFINVTKENPQVQIKINDKLVKYKRLSCIYQSKIGYDTLIQNVFFKELLNLLAATIQDIDIEIKLKNSRIKYLQSR